MKGTPLIVARIKVVLQKNVAVQVEDVVDIPPQAVFAETVDLITATPVIIIGKVSLIMVLARDAAQMATVVPTLIVARMATVVPTLIVARMATVVPALSVVRMATVVPALSGVRMATAVLMLRVESGAVMAVVLIGRVLKDVVLIPMLNFR